VLKKISFWTALSWSGIIVYLCLIKSSNIPIVDITNLDKLVHAFFYFVFTLLWFFVFDFYFKNTNRIKLLFISFLSSFFFGIVIEIFQAVFTTTRNGDVLDVLANSTGALVAIVLLIVLDKNKIYNKI
jgi:VanZ family protein